MTNLTELRKRGTDSTAETRCDRRTLCTLYQHFSKTQPVASISHLIRLTLEMTENAILENHPEYEVDSVEDADKMLAKFFSKHSLNRSGKNITMLKKQLEKESAFLDGTSLAEGMRVTKAMRGKAGKELDSYLGKLKPDDLKEIMKDDETTPSHDLRMPGDVVETPEEAVVRREQESDDMKGALGTVPENVVKED